MAFAKYESFYHPSLPTNTTSAQVAQLKPNSSSTKNPNQHARISTHLIAASQTLPPLRRPSIPPRDTIPTLAGPSTSHAILPSRARPNLPLLRHRNNLSLLRTTPPKPLLRTRLPTRLPRPPLLTPLHRLPRHHAPLPRPLAPNNTGASRQSERGDG